VGRGREKRERPRHKCTHLGAPIGPRSSTSQLHIKPHGLQNALVTLRQLFGCTVASDGICHTVHAVYTETLQLPGIRKMHGKRVTMKNRQGTGGAIGSASGTGTGGHPRSAPTSS
jgi:hypothetical protein